jgi:hypothetical protein
MTGAQRSIEKKGRNRRPVMALEALEGRQLLSAGITVYEEPGAKFTADLGNFVTIAPGTGLQATVNWGDGTTSKGVLKSDGVVGVDEINFEVDGTHKYRKAGTYAIKATVFQPGPSPTTYVRLVASFSDTAIVSRGNTVLNGEVSGTYLAAPTSVAIGAEYIFNGTGTAGVLGAVSAHGDVILPGPTATTTATATGMLTLTNISASPVNSGSVTLKLTGPTESSLGTFPTTLTYVITGGTGAFAGATGVGTIAVTLGSDGSNSFTFDITSLLPPTPVV